MTLTPTPSQAIQLLVGKPLSGTFRALDMEMFHFGPRIPIVSRRGIQRTTGEYRLHVQCPWRLVRAGTIIVGYDDLTKPPTGEAEEPMDLGSGAKSYRDELVQRFLAEVGQDDRVVQKQTTTTYGDARLTFRDGSKLELFPAASGIADEFWRLLKPDGSHAVMTGGGLEIVTPDPKT